MFNITDKGINLLINSIEQQKDKYFWIRSPDSQEQIYITEGFQQVWGHSNEKLFEHPKSFVDAVIKEENRNINKLFEERAFGNQQEREKTLLIRIRAADNSIIHWRDQCFCLCDSYGNIIGVAGVGEKIDPSEWYHDLEGKITEASPLALLKQSQYSRYVVNEKPESIPFTHIEIPCRRVKSRYYVLTWQLGEVALTQREMECVYYLIAGMTAKQTAKELSISPRVVEEYLGNIRYKLNCTNKMEIIKTIKHIIR